MQNLEIKVRVWEHELSASFRKEGAYELQIILECCITKSVFACQPALFEADTDSDVGFGDVPGIHQDGD